jgi:hypothetical protein
LALMPLSQAASWYLILKQALYPSIFKISIFYCLWALYNRFVMGATLEMGHYSMGGMAIASLVQKRTVSIIACLLVLFNFLAFSYWILWSLGVKELALLFKGTGSTIGIVWAWTFKAYFVSQIALWSHILWKLWKDPNSPYEPILG